MIFNVKKAKKGEKSMNFKLTTDHELRKLKVSIENYIPTPKQLGMSESEYNSLGDDRLISLYEVYRNWAKPLLESKMESKLGSHWTNTLPKEKKQEIIIRSLSIAGEVIDRIYMKNDSEIHRKLCTRIAYAKPEDYVDRKLTANQIKRLPAYSDGKLTGGDYAFFVMFQYFFKSKYAKGTKNTV